MSVDIGRKISYPTSRHDLRRATPDPLDLPDPPARKDPRETVVRLDLPVALARWALLESLDLLARRVALVLMAPL